MTNMSEAFMEMSPTFETKKKTIKEVGADILARFRSRFGGVTSSSTAESDIPTISSSSELPISTTTPELPEALTPAVSEEAVYDKTEFPSAVTEKYFRDWEALNLEANLEIKGRMRRNIINSEKKHQELFDQVAKEAGLTVEEFKRKLQERVEAIVNESHFFRATSVSVLNKVLNEDGRYKSQFETNESNGCLNQRYRTQAEMMMFGFNELKELDLSSVYRGSGIPDEAVDGNKENRPIYGYFSNSECGAINNDGEIPPPNSVERYGKVTVKIKKERALQKTTICFQDSLRPKDDWPPTPASKPHFTSLELEEYIGVKIFDRLEKSCKTKWGASYTEAQFHGQLRVDDIEAIYISKKNNLYDDDIEEVKTIYNKFKETHPESEIKIIEY